MWHNKLANPGLYPYEKILTYFIRVVQYLLCAGANRGNLSEFQRAEIGKLPKTQAAEIDLRRFIPYLSKG